MAIHTLDLNLLLTLDLLLAEESVSRTAVRLGISQAAVSAQLARLRSHFDDELLVASGRRLVKTPFAASLAEGVSEFVEQARRLSSTRQRFDHSSAVRQFRVRAGDIDTFLLLAAANRRLRQEAPGITLRISHGAGADHRRRSDVSISPLGIHDFSMPYTELYQDEYCVLCDAGIAEMREGISADDYLRAQHVVRHSGATDTPSLEATLMQRQGHVRKVGAIVDAYASIPYFLLGTRHISTVPRRYAEEMARHFPLRILDLPIEFPRQTVVAQWPRHLDNDVGALWFRNLLRETADEVYRPPALNALPPTPAQTAATPHAAARG